MSKEFKVEWTLYDKNTTEYEEEKDSMVVDAESEEEAIELCKQWIFDNTDHETHPDMMITETGIDFGTTEYCRFESKEFSIEY